MVRLTLHMATGSLAVPARARVHRINADEHPNEALSRSDESAPHPALDWRHPVPRTARITVVIQRNQTMTADLDNARLCPAMLHQSTILISVAATARRGPRDTVGPVRPDTRRPRVAQRSAPTPDVTAQVDQPTLVIATRTDRGVPFAHAQSLLNSIRHAETHREPRRQPLRLARRRLAGHRRADPSVPRQGSARRRRAVTRRCLTRKPPAGSGGSGNPLDDLNQPSGARLVPARRAACGRRHDGSQRHRARTTAPHAGTPRLSCIHTGQKSRRWTVNGSDVAHIEHHPPDPRRHLMKKLIRRQATIHELSHGLASERSRRINMHVIVIRRSPRRAFTSAWCRVSPMIRSTHKPIRTPLSRVLTRRQDWPTP